MDLKKYSEIVNECKELGARKNKDYSRYVDNIGLTGLNGIGVRLMDKAIRLFNLTRDLSDKPAIKEESIRDTFMDTVNYAIYGIMILDGYWGKGNTNNDLRIPPELLEKNKKL